MGINGDNNRVAGRDYYELNTVLKLTTEQLRQLAIKPCARCESRVVSSDATVCNHCLGELQSRARSERRLRYAFVILLVWGGLMQWQNSHSAEIPPQRFLELGVIATAMVLLFAGVWPEVRQWWLANGDELLRILVRLVMRLFKGSK